MNGPQLHYSPQRRDLPSEVPGILGVLGGMGPLATADWLGALVRATPATRDQEHVPVLVHSVPQIPDRNEAILWGGADPAPALLDGLARLEAGGASIIAMPCNTAHRWHSILQSSTSLPVLHIVDGVSETLSARGISGPIGLLATSATLRAEIYERRLGAAGCRCLHPEPDQQEALMQAIRAVKSGRPTEGRAAARAAAAALIGRGAQAVVLACTELPLLVPDSSQAPFIDAGFALAEMCVRWWMEARGSH